MPRADSFGLRVVVGKIGGEPRLKALEELSKEGSKVPDIVIIGEQLWVRAQRLVAPDNRTTADCFFGRLC